MNKVYLLRHGQTPYNVFESDILKKLNLGPNDDKLAYYIRFMKNDNLVDAGLTEFGKIDTLKKCEQYEQQIKGIKYVIVSPCNRALETTRLFFNSKENNQIKFIVHPDLRTVLESQYDIPLRVKENMQEYQEYDFSRVKRLYDQYGFLWFLHDLFQPNKKKGVIDRLEKLDLKTDKETAYALLDIMKEQSPVMMEERLDIYHRLVCFKKWLGEFIREKELKDEQVCLVAHSTIFKILTAKTFDNQYNESNYADLKNSELYEHSMFL